MGVCGTLTMQLMQVYDCSAETAYYYFAVWGTGLTLGNCLSSCMLKRSRQVIFFSYITLSAALVFIGPSNLLPIGFLPEEFILTIMGVGLFAVGLSSAFL